MDRQQTNRKFEEEERYFLAAVVDSSQDSIVTIDFDNVITSWNQAAENLYGYPAAQAVGKNLSMVVLPADIQELFKSVDKIKHGGVVKIYETVRLHKQGHFLELEIMLSPVRNSHNKIIGVSTIARDITERKKIQTALEQSERRFSAIINQATVGIYQTDLAGNLTLANSKLCEMLGYREQDLVGTSIWQYIYAEDRQLEGEMFDKMINTNRHFETERRLVRRDGSLMWVNESITAIVNEGGQPESTIGILLDISQRKLLEQQKDDFLGIASHELKTPLTSVKAYGEILQDKLVKSDFLGLLTITEKLNHQIDRLNALTEDLLDTARLSEGRLILYREALALNDVVASSVESYAHVSKNHVLRFQPGRVGQVFADRTRIEEVLDNFFSNAIKYSPDGGNVFVATEPVKGGVKVSVRDEGLGIPQDSQKHVFDRFYRAKNDGNGVGGFGLGLYISAGIIKSHGGQIGVESELGKGSVFYFVLPV